ncbi:MAG: DUF4340 domain-containing protein [Treponema sp.]|nr:DUF4340 domain-containing protein [Treponema sp.]
MIKLNKTKIGLLAAITVLLAVCIVQSISANRTNVKLLLTDEDISFVSIKFGEQNFTMTKNEGAWYLADGRKIQDSRANAIVNSISEIKVLGTVASSAGQALEKYGLDSPVMVEAFSGNRQLRSLTLGKVTATGSQCYASIDGKQSVLLVQGALRTTLEATPDEIAVKEEKQEEAAETSQDDGSQQQNDSLI